MSKEQHYQWKDCSLTARGIVLTCDTHDQPIAQELLVLHPLQPKAPCREAKKFWYQGAYSGEPVARHIFEAGERAIKRRRAPLGNEDFLAVLPFRGGILKLLPCLSEKQMRYLVAQATPELLLNVAELKILPPQFQPLLLQEGQPENVHWAMVWRADLRPELQLQLALRKEATIRQGLAQRPDLQPELQWVLAESREYHILNDLRNREDLLTGVREKIDTQYHEIELAGGDGYEWMDL